MFTTSGSSNLDGIIANKPAEHKIILNQWDQVYNQRDLSQFVKIINDETETFKCMNLPGKPTEPTTTEEPTTEPTTVPVTEPVTEPITTSGPTTEPDTSEPTTELPIPDTTTETTTTETVTVTTTKKPCANYELPEQSIVYKQFFADDELERIFECIQVILTLFNIFVKIIYI